MIQAVVFDCFGVLTTDMWRAFLATLPDSVNKGRASEINRQYNAGLISRADLLEQVQAVTGKQPDELEAMLKQDMAKNTALIDYIRSDIKPDYKTAILSNVANNWIRDYLLTDAEQKLFDDMVFSYEVGMTKPDPRIYELTCQRLGVEPAQAVLVDDIERYCSAAEQVGLKGIVYEDFDKLKRDLSSVLSQE